MSSKHEEERNAMLSRLEDERREAEQSMAIQRKKHEEEMRVYFLGLPLSVSICFQPDSSYPCLVPSHLWIGT